MKIAHPTAPNALAPAHAELAELLESETHVDMDKLLSLCRHGVPERLRGEAWKYLLGVSRPERSEEMSLGKRMEQEYVEIGKACNLHVARNVRGDVNKHREELAYFRDPRVRQRLESVLRCYLHAQGEDYRPGILHLLGPLAQVYSTEVEVYFTFQVCCDAGGSQAWHASLGAARYDDRVTNPLAGADEKARLADEL